MFSINTEKIKQEAIYLSKNLLILVGSLFIIHLIFKLALPLLSVYKEGILEFFDYFRNNLLLILTTIFIIVILFYIIRNFSKKIRFLFSEETTDQNIYEESLDAWKQKKYDIVYDNMNYIYEMSQKENIHNVYSETAKAMLLFQKTDFSNEKISRKDIEPIIATFLNTFKYKELLLNTIHLAYTFLHLTKVEDDMNKKAIYHLICMYLFSRADQVTYKNRIEIESRIFNSYFDQNKESILQLIPIEMVKIMTNYQTKLSEEDFRKYLIPFLSKQI